MAAHLFGEHLKREREMRGVSLEEISTATRISVRFLEALENERWELLPGGIFNRGFIRSIARFLGLDEEDLIAEYALETRERPEIAVWTKEPVHPRPNWTAIVIWIVLLAGVVVGGWYVQARYGPAIRAWHQKHPLVETILARFHHRKPPRSSQPSSASAPRKPGKGTGAGSPSGSASASPGALTSPAQSAGDGAVNAGASRSAEARPASSKQALAKLPLELKVEAGETSLVTVVADGKTVFSGRLPAQHSLSFTAKKGFTVSSSKSNAVLLELDGQTVPPLGPPGQPGKITLTRENLNPGSGGED